MEDIFNQIVLCKKCGKKMRPSFIVRDGFKIRMLKCDGCSKTIYHPKDIEEFKKFSHLKQRPFAVKLRMVGNSYTVSIPREIINLEQEMNERMARHMDRMNRIVRLMLESPGKLSLFFNEDTLDEEKKEKGKRTNLFEVDE